MVIIRVIESANTFCYVSKCLNKATYGLSGIGWSGEWAVCFVHLDDKINKMNLPVEPNYITLHYPNGNRKGKIEWD